MKRISLMSIFCISLYAQADTALMEKAKTLFSPLPHSSAEQELDNATLIKLGKTLFMDTRLSVNDSQSCHSCHRLDDHHAGVDNQPLSKGALGQLGGRNTPTVINTKLQFAQFWDGRADNLAAQALGPILNPLEMAMPDIATLEKKLANIPEYDALFASAFGSDNPITANNIAVAIAAFESTLISHDRFDEFLSGKQDALTEQEKNGLQDFIDTGCAGCHSGAALGGTMYMKMGLINAYNNQADTGRMQVSQQEADRMMFKVPMLRNVGLTAPYFHDGSVTTLEEAVEQMAWLQLGKKLDEATIKDIAAFLRSLDSIH